MVQREGPQRMSILLTACLTKLIGSTRLLPTQNQKLKGLTPIDDGKLMFLDCSFDQVIQWGRETLETTGPEICRWLRTHRVRWPDRRPFRLPQSPSTIKRYVRYYKQLIHYVFHTGLLNDDVCERLYGIHFTPQQRELIREISQMLPESRPDLSLSPEDSDVESESEHDFDDDTILDDNIDVSDDECSDDIRDEDLNMDGDSDGDEGTNDESTVFEYRRPEPLPPEADTMPPAQIDLSRRVAEKLLELCIQFITQRFLTGYDPHAPLLHFSAVLSIQIQQGSFRESLTSTPLLAGLIWTSRLLSGLGVCLA